MWRLSESSCLTFPDFAVKKFLKSGKVRQLDSESPHIAKEYISNPALVYFFPGTAVFSSISPGLDEDDWFLLEASHKR